MYTDTMQRKSGLSLVANVVVIAIIAAAGLILYPSLKLNGSSSPTPTASLIPDDKPADLEINIDSNQVISSPIEITGKVPAGWMFEGSFPIYILDHDKKVIAQSYGEPIEGENWMSDNPVEFNATLTFKTSETSGFVRLAKDNPSGLPENDASYDIPIKFVSNKTYQDSSLDFSFQVPTLEFEDLKIIDISDYQYVKGMQAQKALAIPWPASDAGSILDIFIFQSNLDLEEWWQQEGLIKLHILSEEYSGTTFYPQNKSNYKILDKRNGQLAGNPSTIVDITIDVAAQGGELYPEDFTINIVKNNKNIFMFVHSKRDTKDDLSNQILFSFKFTN